MNGLIAAGCLGFIGSVYTYSVTKMRTAGDDISEEIALHEATVLAARRGPEPKKEAPPTATAAAPATPAAPTAPAALAEAALPDAPAASKRSWWRFW